MWRCFVLIMLQSKLILSELMIASTTCIVEYIHIVIVLCVSAHCAAIIAAIHDASDTVMDQFDELGSVIHSHPTCRKPSLNQVRSITLSGSRSNLNSRSTIQHVPRDTCCCRLSG